MGRLLHYDSWGVDGRTQRCFHSSQESLTINKPNNKQLNTKETAKQILKEINSYSVEIRGSFKDIVNESMQHIKSKSFLVRLEEYMKTSDYTKTIAWARNYQ